MNTSLSGIRTLLLAVLFGATSIALSQTVVPTSAERSEAQKLGVPENEIVGFVHRRRNPNPKPIDLSKPLMTGQQLQEALIQGRSATNLCTHGGFEQGSLAGWMGAVGTYNSTNTTASHGIPLLNMPAFTATGFVTNPANVNSQHTILPITNVAWNGAGLNAWNGPLDPTVASFAGVPAIPLPFPSGGSRWFRLGNRFPGFGAEGVQGSFVITPANAKFGFEYAIVAQEPQNLHPTGDRPQFIYQLQVGGVVVDSINRYPDQTDSFWNVGPMNPPGLPGGQVLWRRVSCHMKDLTAYIGQVATVTFINTDCSWGGHWGYTYLDRFCDPMLGKPVLDGIQSSYCEGDPILADGSKSSGVTQHTWTVTRLDVQGNPIAATTKSQTLTGALAGPVNVGAWYSSKGGTWVCGSKYRITLSINTECTTNEKVSKDIYIECCRGCCTKEPVRASEELVSARTSPLYPGSHVLSPTISWTGGRRRVEVSVLNAWRFTPATNQSHRSFAYIKTALPSTSAPPMTGVVPNLIYPWVARWESLIPVASTPWVSFPMVMHLAPPVTGKDTYLRLTLLFRAYDADCQACDLVQSYSFKWDGKNWEGIHPKDWPPKGPIEPGPGGPGDPVPNPGRILPRVGLNPPLQGAGMKWNPLNPLPDPSKPLWPTLAGPLPPLNCCHNQYVRMLQTEPKLLSHTGNTGVYAFTPSISSNVVPASRVELSIINAAAASPNSNTYPAWASLQGAVPVAGFAPPVVVASPFSHMIRYTAQTGGVSLITPVTFPMHIQLPKPATASPIYVHFTLRATVMSNNCRPCDTYERYYLMISPGGKITQIKPQQWPIAVEGPKDPPGGNKRDGGNL